MIIVCSNFATKLQHIFKIDKHNLHIIVVIAMLTFAFGNKVD